MRDPRRWTAAAVTVAVLAALVVLALRVPAVHDALRHVLDGDTDALRTELREQPVVGALVLVVLVQVHVVVPYPAEIALAAAGFVYGFWIGVPLMLAAWLVSGLIGYALGLWLGRPAVRRLLGARRIERTELLLERAGALPLIAARLVPVVPFTIASVVSGVLRVPVLRFAWTTVVGFLPLTCAVVLLGHRLDDLSPTDPVLWAAVAVLLGLLLAARPVIRRIEGRAA
ncbi:VTT domain-containing protein [Patulibacter sp. SYSU D01012]|uniref:TVP38/TMEM64 family protein n=1 Tax=Patulibacter sp. SYSU D01012 TaxID=2817381 RepID=UPI001B31573E|nr:VTT domain-containing protein [Patulibacter sp. SYSU D01012]